MKYNQLTEVERYQIQAYLKADYSQKEIAEALGRHPSTISREIRRNTGLRGYRPQQAHRLAQERKKAYCHTLITDKTWQRVKDLLREDWSPEQVSGWLKSQSHQSVSIEWIYQHILTDKQAGGDLYKHLRCQKKRKKRYGASDSRRPAQRSG